ncbi:MAG: thioredoxin family protein, partial [Gemmatimonadetes bacterium]|nr:thioredoxin family protein [Gemmatimonadota bacterium]NIQ59597.1 thioredoxin family protein [Gemmatimonadota bacterium]NIU79803.1 thioredoxin family protein [Gammaproteobacteria bacterium]NIX45319.1 thioredoxin family protein [Gemmatimonadota bacterium]NIY12752.1 thioredoxin family protein [Gemmatimonadota bacterium]
MPLKQLLGVDREASRRYRPFWTPTLFFLDPDGRVLSRWPGLIPPAELLPQLDLGEALVGLRRGRFE